MAKRDDTVLNLNELKERNCKNSKGKKDMMKMYKAVYEDEEFEIIYADNDNEAMKEADRYEIEHGIVFNLFEIDENYDEIRTVH